MKIRELIVVEGAHDRQRLEKLLDCQVICTGGLGLDENAMKMIVRAQDDPGVIVLTDADNAGERIRSQIMKIAPHCRHAYIAKKDSTGKRNVGVEFAADEKILEALRETVSYQEGKETISWPEYLELGLMGNKALREKVCTRLNIGLYNNRTLYKRLNMLAIDARTVREIIDED